MSFPFLSAAIVAILLLGGWGIGRALGRRAGLVPAAGAEEVSQTLWLLMGLGLIGQVTFVAGATGRAYTRAVIGPLVVVCGLVAIWELRKIGTLLAWPTWWKRGNGGLIVSTLAVILCGFSLWNATGFTTGSDVLSHYYPHVQHMLTTHRFGYEVQLPYGTDHTSNYNPGLTEQLFLICQLLADERASNLLSAITSVLAFCCLYGLGKAVDSPRAGWLAVGVYLGASLLAYFPWEPQDYTLTAAFLLAAIEMLFRYRNTRNARWLWLAGAAAGLMASTKGYGLIALGPLALLAAFASLDRRRLRSGIVFTATALAVVSPWLIYSFWQFGNPLYPAMSDNEYVRLHAVYYPLNEMAPLIVPVIGSAFTAKFLYWFSMFVPISAPYATFGLSPVFLLALPISIYHLWRFRHRLREDQLLFGLAVLLFGALYLVLSSSAFYKWVMFPGLVYAVSIAAALNRWRGWQRRIAWTLVLVVAGLNLWLNVRPTARYYFPVRATQAERWDPVARELNARLEDGIGVAGIGHVTGYYLRPGIRRLVTDNNELATSWPTELRLIREVHMDLLLTSPTERRLTEDFYSTMMHTADVLDPSGRKSRDLGLIRDQVMTRTAEREQFIARCTTPYITLSDGSALVRLSPTCRP